MVGKSGSEAVGRTGTRPLVCLVAAVVAATFLLVGVLGFIPGVTTDYDQMRFAGHESEAMLFGLFQVSILHNIVHLLFGVVWVGAGADGLGRAVVPDRRGAVYALLWLYGLVIDHDTAANLVPLNDADNWLQLGLAVGMVALGLLIPARAGARGRR